MPEARNQCSTAFGGLYDFYIERPRLSQLIARTVWGIDLAPMYRRIAALSAEQPGTRVADIPCGGGLALSGIGPGQELSLVCVDIDATMIARTQSKALRLGLSGVETLEADMRDLPIEPRSVDLICSFSGLHMINDPEAAIAEFARVLRPGGRLVGSSFLGDGSRRKRAVFGAAERRGVARPPRDATALANSLGAAGFSSVEVSGRGFADFSAVRA